jgi:4-hydroxy-tetrahydrodipicolinate reductase
VSRPLRTILVGATGRMGLALEQAALRDGGFDLVHRVGRENLALLEQDLDALQADLLIDFSSPDALGDVARLCGLRRIPLLSGTTGLTAQTEEQLDEAARHTPLLHTANTSLGVAMLRRLVTLASSALPASFDIEVVETHHRLKKDAPSGTAKLLAGAAHQGRAASAVMEQARFGHFAPRAAGEIGMAALRGGDVIGEHTVHFLGDGERLELTHRATDRSLFANGALTAGRWLVAQPPGRYTMDNLFGG